MSALIRRLAPERLRITCEEFDHMMELGIVLPSSSSWASPLHMVPKCIPGDWRPCGDFCAVNKVTVPDRYTVPHLQDFSAALEGATILSHIDLVRAYCWSQPGKRLSMSDKGGCKSPYSTWIWD